MPKRRQLPKLHVVERKLGREKALGLCHQRQGLVEIDTRHCSKEYLDTMIHEMLHMYFPEAEEEKVTRVANKMTQVLWRRNFRRLKE
jgi:hypothetical protein